MKTDQEIKEFIDSRDVLTKVELSRFIYRWAESGGAMSKPSIVKWWGYVLRTKNWCSLNKYRQDKNGILRRKEYDRFVELCKKDKRLLDLGKYRVRKILAEKYGVNISVTTTWRYQHELRQKIANKV